MYLGVHSLNQVFFGLLMGAWFALSGHFILKGIVLKMVKNVINGKHTGLCLHGTVAFVLFIAVFAV